MEIPESIQQFIVDNFRTILNVGLILLITWLVLKSIKILSNRLKKKFTSSEFDLDRQARLLTIESVAITSLRALVLAVAVFTLLGTLGFNLAPLVASVGIAGLAISLGAQSLIKDFLSGFLIVLEDQFGVGDFIEVGEVKGTVEKITLRTVSLREFSGRLDIVPNGEIRVVSNYSRDWIRSIVDLFVPFDADVGKVVEALEEAMQAAKQDETAQELLLEGPQVTGWNSNNDWGVQIRLTARVQVGQQVAVEGIFRQYALESLRKRGITLAVPGRI